MDSIDTELAARIRRDIIFGTIKNSERVSEAQLCESYNVSRTPVRLALRLLEREGLVKRGEGRGYHVQSPSIQDIKQAVLVLGHLESLAARLMAQQPKQNESISILKNQIDEIDHLLSTLTFDDASLQLIQQHNAVFHKTIMENCGNNFVNFTCNQISHLPMLEVGLMVFDKSVLSTEEGVERSIFRLKLGNSQHKVICEAIEKGDSVRSEGMMREHLNILVEYIELFEKSDEKLTLSNLITYSGIELSAFKPTKKEASS